MATFYQKIQQMIIKYLKYSRNMKRPDRKFVTSKVRDFVTGVLENERANPNFLEWVSCFEVLKPSRFKDDPVENLLAWISCGDIHYWDFFDCCMADLCPIVDRPSEGGVVRQLGNDFLWWCQDEKYTNWWRIVVKEGDKWVQVYPEQL